MCAFIVDAILTRRRVLIIRHFWNFYKLVGMVRHFWILRLLSTFWNHGFDVVHLVRRAAAALHRDSRSADVRQEATGITITFTTMDGTRVRKFRSLGGRVLRHCRYSYNGQKFSNSSLVLPFSNGSWRRPARRFSGLRVAHGGTPRPRPLIAAVVGAAAAAAADSADGDGAVAAAGFGSLLVFCFGLHGTHRRSGAAGYAVQCVRRSASTRR